MAGTKLTFSLDEETVARLRRVAERLHRPQSEIVREAIAEYAVRAGRLSTPERERLLRTFDEVVPAIPARPQVEVEEELAELRRARRQGGRSSPPAGRK